MPSMPDGSPISEEPEKQAFVQAGDTAMKKAFADHGRRWQEFHYVYPVISRRSRGLSIGVNLNIDKACNFDCIYCCVDRSVAPVRKDVNLDQVREELAQMLRLVETGSIWSEPRFAGVSPRYRRLTDIAFSGDGEPTAYPQFDRACEEVISLKKQFGLDPVKIVVITNATMFDRPMVQRALGLLDANQGEVWAKLDAGTDEYYQRVDRTNFPFRKVLDNILACGQARPIVIQSLFMQVHSQPVSEEEFDAYLARLAELIQKGCQIKLVQLYTTARWTAERYVQPLTDQQMDRLMERFRATLPGVPSEVYYGAAAS